MKTVYKISIIGLILGWILLFIGISMIGLIPVYIVIPAIIFWLIGTIFTMILVTDNDFWKKHLELTVSRDSYVDKIKETELMIEAIKRISLKNAGITQKTIYAKIDELSKIKT